MIKKGMDITELTNSCLFYPPIWAEVSVFSHHQESRVVPYHGEIAELAFEDPTLLFPCASAEKHPAAQGKPARDGHEM